MRKLDCLAAAAFAAALLAPLAAIASPISTTDYGFTFTGTGVYVGYNVAGTLTVNNAVDLLSVGGLGHDVVNISGSATTPALGVGGPISGPITTNVFSPAPDNYFYPAGPDYTDANGIAFQDASGNLYDIYTLVVVATVAADPMHIDDVIGGGFLEVPGIFALTSPTPIPAAAPLFVGGLGLVSLLARRRKRKNAAAIAV